MGLPFKIVKTSWTNKIALINLFDLELYPEVSNLDISRLSEEGAARLIPVYDQDGFINLSKGTKAGYVKVCNQSQLSRDLEDINSFLKDEGYIVEWYEDGELVDKEATIFPNRYEATTFALRDLYEQG